MAVEILMPELGESVHEGTVSRWLKQVGEFVKEDEPVVEIMTDKVNTELQAPASGILTKILIPEGGLVEVFHAMGIIEESGSAGATASVEPEMVKEAAAAVAKESNGVAPAPAAQPEPVAAKTSGERRWFTPVVRSIAKQNGISEDELSGIKGSGGGGRVTKRDVEAYMAGGKKAAPSATPSVSLEPKPVAASTGGGSETVALVGMRKMIADHMVKSASIPTVSTVTSVDVTNMVLFREKNKETFQQMYGVKLTYTPFFMKALAESLAEFPLLNAALIDGSNITMNKSINIGISVALGAKGEGGLIVPVIKDCQSKTLVEIARDLDSIAARARSNSLQVTDVQGGTFTLTNPGSYGALFGTPMISAPQAGILGAYGISKQPVIIDDMIAIRSIMHLVLTYDHRLIDGMLAGRFLANVRDRLQNFDFFK